MRTYLVAVVAPSQGDVMKFLAASPLGPESEDREIDSWWIAEDDREDGADMGYDSAIFVPSGSQRDMGSLVAEYMVVNAQRHVEDGWPWSPESEGPWSPDTFRVRQEETIRAAALAFLHGRDVNDIKALGPLADALGVPRSEVDALSNETKEN